MSNQKGFTLIELLVVIAIVAILSVVVILTLNPAELLKQARDSNRVSDMSTVKSALSLYLADGWTVLAADYTRCYTSNGQTTSAACGSRFAGGSFALSNRTATSTNSNGTGWLGASTSTGGPNFASTTTGAPISQLPLDPTNDATYYYAYAASSSNSYYELNANLESTKYTSGAGNLEGTDGGNDGALYETGTYLQF